MHRFLVFLTVFLLLNAGPILAAEPVYAPPLDGEMAKLKVLEKPDDLPDVVFTTVNGPKRLSDYRGKIVILNLWATWCPPCLQELPSLNALQTALGTEKIQVLAISMDSSGINDVKKYLDDHQLSQLAPMMDPEHGVQEFEVLKKTEGIPVTIIIDPQMRALAHFEGQADWNGSDARAMLDYTIKHVSYLPYKL